MDHQDFESASRVCAAVEFAEVGRHRPSRKRRQTHGGVRSNVRWSTASYSVTKRRRR